MLGGDFFLETSGNYHWTPTGDAIKDGGLYSKCKDVMWKQVGQVFIGNNDQGSRPAWEAGRGFDYGFARPRLGLGLLSDGADFPG